MAEKLFAWLLSAAGMMCLSLSLWLGGSTWRFIRHAEAVTGVVKELKHEQHRRPYIPGVGGGSTTTSSPVIQYHVGRHTLSYQRSVPGPTEKMRRVSGTGHTEALRPSRPVPAHAAWQPSARAKQFSPSLPPDLFITFSRPFHAWWGLFMKRSPTQRHSACRAGPLSTLPLQRNDWDTAIQERFGKWI